MDWQVIILTLGASLITGIISIVSNIIISNANLKKSIIESNKNLQQDYINSNKLIYDNLLSILNDIECYFSKQEIDKLDTAIDTFDNYWKSHYNYCSNELNLYIKRLMKSYQTTEIKEININNIREQIKRDTDKIFGLNDK